MMTLAPARPRPKPSQSEFSSDLSTQREDDPESGLMHYRARSYDPRVGRFVQKDPLLPNVATQHYVCADNSPTTRLDPSGKKSKKEWQAQALREAGIDLATWSPAEGFLKNADNMRKVYSWYRKTWERDREHLHWAGLAYPAGGSVYGGLQDMQGKVALALSVSKTPTTAVWTTKRFTALEAAVVTINRDIFMDLAWQHIAFLEGGYDEMRARWAANEIDRETLDAWGKLRFGDAPEVWEGNYDLLRREQRDIAPAGYALIVALGLGMVKDLSTYAVNPVIGEKEFAAVFPNGNLTLFEDRWKWISQHIWGPWKGLTPDRRATLISTPFDDVIRRRFPQ